MSGRIPKNFISTLLERVDIVEVINQRVLLKKTGTKYSACCPFHNEKTPSFSVNAQKQYYYCFGCGASGDAIAFLTEFEKLTFVEAIEQLAKSAGLEVPYEDGIKPQENNNKTPIFQLMEIINAYYQSELSKSSTAKNYLKTRNLSPQILKKFQLGYAPEGWHQLEIICGNQPGYHNFLIEAGMLVPKDNAQAYDRFRQRLMFPIRNRRGHIIGFGGRTLGNDTPKYLNSPETPLFHKSHELYGLFEAQTAIRDAKKIIVVEGYMDVIALAQFDICNAVATLGTAVTEEHIKLLLKYASDFVFCFDGDNAGRKAAWRALEIALTFVHEGINFMFCFLPEGEDPDSYVQKQGKEKFFTLLKSSLSLSDFFMQYLASDVDLTTIDGKTQFCNKAKPLLQKITSGVYQQLLLQQLAKIIRLEEAVVYQLMDIAPLSKIIPKPSRLSQAQQVTTPIRLAITLLLQYPKLIQHVELPAKFSTVALPGKELLLTLVELITLHPHINTAALLHHLNTHPQLEIIKKLAARELFYDENGLIQEFIDIMNRLKQNCRELEMEHLLGKASLLGLSNDDKKRLQTLLSKQDVT